jgi:hypothetical protein
MRSFTLSIALAACTPSIDPAAQKDVDNQLAQLQQQDRQLGPPSSMEPMPLAVGQWTRHRMMDDKNQPSLVTYKIVGQEADAFWVELALAQYSGKTLQKMLVKFGDRKDPSTVEVRDAWMMDKKGQVTHIDGPVLAMMKGALKSALQSMTGNWQTQSQEDAQVMAGHFAACYRVQSEATFLGHTYKSEGWFHPSVPISGAVKSHGIDKPYTMELVDFGTSGAMSEFPPAP